MCNYVANNVTLVGEEKVVKEAIEFVKGKGDAEGTCFSLDSINPMPKELEITSGSNTDDGVRYLVLKQKKILCTEEENDFIAHIEKRDDFNEILELGKKALSNIAKYGHRDWYSWRIAEWGTKWDVCDAVDGGYHVGEDGIAKKAYYFDTAWNAPINALITLSEKFPSLTIEIVYADEDVSYNTGRGTIENGCVGIEYADGGDEGYENYFETHEGAADDYVKDKDGHWVYIDDYREEPEPTE